MESLSREIAERADRVFTTLESLSEDIKSSISEDRLPSKAAYILGERSDSAPIFEFFKAVAMARSTDYDEQHAGKAALADMGSRFGEPMKAVLGDTDAAGGYIVPRNIVAEAVETTVTASPVRELLNTVTGVRTSAAVEIPLEGPSPTRAVIAARGVTKANENFTVGSYSASFYTLARIIDVGNQFLRQSGGAAEKLTRSRLARAFSLGESYYVLSGSGSSEPMGLLTALAAGPAGVTTAHTAADTTVAGSVRAAVATAIEALASRGREVDGVLMNPGDLAHAMVQGSDTGGFWVDSGGGSVGLIGLPGVRIRTSTAVTSKTAIAGEWKSAQLFIGDEYRVDTSSEAGDRWDKNLTGFRAELDLAFNGEPYVAAGMFQRITGLIP